MKGKFKFANGKEKTNIMHLQQLAYITVNVCITFKEEYEKCDAIYKMPKTNQPFNCEHLFPYII